MDEDGGVEHNLSSSSSAWSALVIGAIAGVVPLVVSSSKWSAVWENGRVVEFNYRDNVALFGGLAALVCGALAIFVSRRPSATRTKMIAAGGALVLLGGFHAARGMGVMQEQPTNPALAAKPREPAPRPDAEPEVTPEDCADAKACNELGHSLEEHDQPGALAAYVRGCELGGRGNCSNAAAMLYQGDGVPVDKARAAALSEQACTMGMAESCANFGLQLYEGDGVPQDIARGTSLFDKACAERNALGCYNLGVAQRDHGAAEAAQVSFVASCELGRGDACNSAGIALLKQKDERGARTFFEKACAAAEEQRCYNLGVFHAEGRGGLKKDDAKARAAYEHACAADDPVGCNNLARLIESGAGGPKDVEQARALYQKACDLGDQEHGCKNLEKLDAQLDPK